MLLPFRLQETALFLLLLGDLRTGHAIYPEEEPHPSSAEDQAQGYHQDIRLVSFCPLVGQ